MNVYDAIMKAANQIEHRPDLFEYSVGKVPDCGTPACAAGWVGHYMGVPVGDNMVAGDFCERIFGVGYSEFDYRMDCLSTDNNWMFDAKECAETLRRYARKYHAPELRTDSELVADLMRKISTERIPEDVPA